MEFAQQDLTQIRAAMHMAAKRLGLPFRSSFWRGSVGNWSGVGSGSSIDFQEHRQYQPGDDPRYIDWNVFARSQSYVMKLYREEVSPAVDLLLDSSQSMFDHDQKKTRSLELFFFCVESALRWGAALRCYAICGNQIVYLDNQRLLADRLVLPDSSDAAEHLPQINKVPWRTSSLRIFVSDLLFPVESKTLLIQLQSGRSRAVVYSPFCKSECDPDWQGNLRLIDCESSLSKEHRIDPLVLRRYQEAYTRHFDLWYAESRRYSVPFARVPAELEFNRAMLAEGLQSGAVELWT